MDDTEGYIQRLVESDPLRAPLLRSVISALRFPVRSRGLDAGCGVGLQARLLAQAADVGGCVVGLDSLPRLLEYGQTEVDERGAPALTRPATGRVMFAAGDIAKLPFAAKAFDWVWSADCAGYPAGDLLPALREFTRVVRPGGKVVILGWSSQSLLPGYPLLEARLNATCSAYTPYLRGQAPDDHFMRALGHFREAGLERAEAMTFVHTVRAPLSEGVRTALASLLVMLWGARQPETSCEDWESFERLCRPGSAEFILDLPDYCAFFTYSVFSGQVPD